jgi:hypothetical protein
MKSCQVAATDDQENGGVSIGLLDPIHLGGYGFQSFIPRYPLEFAFSPGACPFHGVLEAIWLIDKLPISAASQACPELLRLWRIIALNPDNHPVLDMKLQRTSATAIVGRRSFYDFQTATWLNFLFSTHINLLIIGTILQISAVGFVGRL